MLSAGTNVEWLRDDLGLIATSDESEAVAASVPDTDGVVYVPALLGLGTPRWDYGARGALLGLTRGSGRAHVVRAVLEGVAERGADLVEAAEADSGVTLEALRIDGGMSANSVFVQAPGRRHPEAGRGLPRQGGHHVGGRVPGRAGRGHVGRLERPGRHVAPRGGGGARCAPRTGTAGRTRSSAPPTGTRTCPPWTSDRTPGPRTPGRRRVGAVGPAAHGLGRTIHRAGALVPLGFRDSRAVP